MKSKIEIKYPGYVHYYRSLSNDPYSGRILVGEPEPRMETYRRALYNNIPDTMRLLALKRRLTKLLSVLQYTWFAVSVCLLIAMMLIGPDQNKPAVTLFGLVPILLFMMTSTVSLLIQNEIKYL